MYRRLKLLLVLALATLIAGDALALQISFPIEAGDGKQIAQSVGLKARSLKEYFDRLQISYGLDAYRIGTQGDRTRAFRPDKTYYQNLLGGRAVKTLKNGVELESNLSLRHVTDPIITIRDDVHITSFYGSATKKDRWSIRAGDLYPNLSRYTFSRFSEGLMGSYMNDVGPVRWNLTGVFSQTERAREANTLRRGASAGAATFSSLTMVRNKPKWEIGYRQSHASDKVKSVDNHGAAVDLHVGSQAVIYSTNLPSGWSIDGENSWSSGTPNRKSLTDSHVRDGFAWLTNISWLKDFSSKPYEGIQRLRPFAFQANWELVDPYYLSPLGVAAADQQRWTVRTAHRWNENLDWGISHLRLQDNVRNQKNVTSTSRTTSVSVNTSFFKLFDEESSTWIKLLPESFLDMKMRGEFRFNDRDASDATVNSKIEDYVYSVTYNNWGTTFTNDYSFQISDDDATPANDRRVQTWGVLATRPIHWKKLDVRLFPRMGYRLSRDRFRLTGRYSDIQTTTLGIGVNWEELSANLNYLILDSNREPAGTDYLQNKVSGDFTYRPYLFPGFQGTLGLAYTDYNDETTSRDYTQLETKMTIRYVF